MSFGNLVARWASADERSDWLMLAHAYGHCRD
jgi:hypothetical protein